MHKEKVEVGVFSRVKIKKICEKCTKIMGIVEGVKWGSGNEKEVKN